MPDIESVMPYRVDLQYYENRLPSEAAQYYADQLIADQVFRADQKDDLVAALERAALYYFLGRGAEQKIKSNPQLAAWLKQHGEHGGFTLLKMPPPHRPKGYSDQGLIWVLANAWEYFGRTAGTAFDGSKDREVESRFTRFCNGWLKAIDPNRRSSPSRGVYRRVLAERSKGT